MQNEPQKPSAIEPSLADWLLSQLQQNPTIVEIHKTHKILDTSALNQIYVLIKTKDGNNIDKLINLLKLFIENPNLDLDLTEINDQINQLLAELSELRDNIKTHRVAINSALDGYTLNKTCRIIKALDEYIANLKKLTTASNTVHALQNRLFAKPISKASPKEREAIAENLKCACENLKSSCETIRSQIGSPETMPRGLVIILTMSIYESINETTKISDEVTEEFVLGFSQELTRLLDKELGQIRSFYPELAEAGEKLQEKLQRSIESDKTTPR